AASLEGCTVRVVVILRGSQALAPQDDDPLHFRSTDSNSPRAGLAPFAQKTTRAGRHAPSPLLL
nr:hypothetical protein [Afipia sp.]